MFDIGASLREARTRRGLSLDDVTTGLRIRERYVTALEEERWDLLPGEAYTKGFLRMYAEFLGLDGSLYVDEYNERVAAHQEEALVPDSLAPSKGRSRLLFRTIVGVVAVAAAVAALNAFGSGSPTSSPVQPDLSNVASAATPKRVATLRAPVAVAGRAARDAVEAARRAHQRGRVTIMALGPHRRSERQGSLPRLPQPGAQAAPTICTRTSGSGWAARTHSRSASARTSSAACRAIPRRTSC